MKESIPPDPTQCMDIFKIHFGEIQEISQNCFMTLEYSFTLGDKTSSPSILLSNTSEFNPSIIVPFTRAQMWECQDHEQVFTECKYDVLANDLLGSFLPSQNRAKFELTLIESLLEIFPSCVAFYFMNSGKLLRTQSVRDILNDQNIPRSDKFFYFSINVRIQRVGEEEFVIDTVGMRILSLPDVQYHFRLPMSPQEIASNAFSCALYIYKNNDPISDGETIAGFSQDENGKFYRDPKIRWKCRREDALVPPMRTVIDVNMNEYAAGNRI